MRQPPASEMYKDPSDEKASRRGRLSVAVNAGPPSPVEDATPVPATAAIVPLGQTTRTRLLA